MRSKKYGRMKRGYEEDKPETSRKDNIVRLREQYWLEARATLGQYLSQQPVINLTVTH